MKYTVLEKVGEPINDIEETLNEFQYEENEVCICILGSWHNHYTQGVVFCSKEDYQENGIENCIANQVYEDYNSRVDEGLSDKEVSENINEEIDDIMNNHYVVEVYGD